MFILVLQMELVYNDCKVHSLMDGAVVVERPGGGERPNGVRVVAIELEVVRHWRVRLSPWLRRTVDPTAVRNDMRHRIIIHQGQTLPF